MQKEKEKRKSFQKNPDPREIRGKPSEVIFSSDDTRASMTNSVEIDYSTNEIFIFLQSCSLEKHFFKFFERNITTIEELKDIQEGLLSEMNIPIGHQIKIQKYLKQYLNELIISKNIKEDHQQNGDLKSNVSSIIKNPIEQISEVTCNSNDSFALTAKISCWSCYKIIPKRLAIIFATKEFCSTICEDKFKSVELKECVCGNTFLKNSGICVRKIWFCSESCINI